MEVEVYADLLFLINAGMDLLCLCVAVRLLHRRPHRWRIVAGAIAGGIYAVIALLLPLDDIPALAVDILACVAMCAIAFGWKGLPVTSAVYTAGSMLLGGVMTALFNLFNRMGVAEHLPNGGEGIGAWLFLVFSVIGSIVTMRGGRLFRRSRAVRLCDVTLEVAGASLSVRGLVDSGNLLRDPIGGQSVICVSPITARKLLSSALWAVMESGGTDVSRLQDTSDIRRLRLIPAGTATGQDILPGFRPDKVILTPDGERPREVDAVIAVTKASPVGAKGFDDMDALIPADLL